MNNMLDTIKVNDIRYDTKQTYITIDCNSVGERYNIALETIDSTDDIDFYFKSNTKSVIELIHMLGLYDNHDNNTHCYISYYDNVNGRSKKEWTYNRMLTHLNLYLLFQYNL